MKNIKNFEIFNEASITKRDETSKPNVTPGSQKPKKCLKCKCGSCECEKKEIKKENLNIFSFDQYVNEKKKPSEGLSKKTKSDIVKKAKKGEDVGKGGFEEVASKAAKKYGSKETGQKVAAAAMWKNIKR